MSIGVLIVSILSCFLLRGHRSNLDLQHIPGLNARHLPEVSLRASGG
jgi:hypothetical protein